jgi:hypothetical protein
MYTYPGPTSPFPRFEAWFTTFGWIGIFVGDMYHVLAVTLLGVICIWCWLPIFIARWVMEKRQVSDFAFSILQNESRFSAVSDAWESVCGKPNRPTWKQLQKIRSMTYKKINHK